MRSATAPNWVRFSCLPSASAMSACSVFASKRVLPLISSRVTMNASLAGNFWPFGCSMVSPVAEGEGAGGLLGFSCCRRVPESGTTGACWAIVTPTGTRAVRMASAKGFITRRAPVNCISLFIADHQIARHSQSPILDLQSTRCTDLHRYVYRDGLLRTRIRTRVAGRGQHLDRGRGVYNLWACAEL